MESGRFWGVHNIETCEWCAGKCEFWMLRGLYSLRNDVSYQFMYLHNFQRL
jgi:hypothetical protein